MRTCIPTVDRWSVASRDLAAARCPHGVAKYIIGHALAAHEIEMKSQTPMRDLEKYYGVHSNRKQSMMQILGRSSRSKAKQTAERILREVNALYVKGLYSQCLGLLERAVQLVPNDPRPFYLLGLIHEERRNFEKAQTSFYICALLRRGDTTMWRKVLNMSVATDDCRSQAIALGKIYRREPSEALILKRMECFGKLRKKYWLVACEIELFDYRAIDNSIFDRFRNTHHKSTIKIICHRLLECIQRNESARNEYFVRNTVFNLYKIKDWARILRLLDDFYFGAAEELASEIRAIHYMAYVLHTKQMQEKAAAELEGGDERSARGHDSKTAKEAEYAFSFVGATESLIKWGLDETSASEGTEMDGKGEEIAGNSKGASLLEEPMQLDSCLLLEGFVLDRCEWDNIKDSRYFIDLADLLRNLGLLGHGIEILEKLYVQKPSTKLNIKIADFIHLSGNMDAAIARYNRVLTTDPTNMQAKARLHRLYTELGESSLAREYEMSVRAFKHSEDLDGRSKKKYRYSSDRCRRMRAVYERANAALSGSENDYLDCTRELLADFFANPFITVKYKNFKSFLIRHEPVVKESGVVLYDDTASRRKLSEKLIRISSLHGLDIDEWYSVIQSTVMCMIRTDDCSAALRLARSALPVHLFRENRYLLPLSLLGVKSALRVGDFETIVEISKHLIVTAGYSASFFLYFLCNFFPDFFRFECFNSFQKNVQRIWRKSASIQPGCTGSHREQHVLSGPDSKVTPYLVANSYIPRYLFTETVDELSELGDTGREEVAIIIGVLHIAHSRSRVVCDKMKYARFGTRLISSIPGDSPVKNYNLAKAYHFFGYYAQAEALYFRAIEAGSGELRRMGVFNLSLIFRRNKSRSVLCHLLKKYSLDR